MTSFKYQTEIHRAEERFRLVCGGRRIGKSVLGGREGFAQLTVPESMVWIVGPTMDLAEKEFRVIWNKTVKDGWIPVTRKSERELYIRFENGSFVECRSEENPDQLIGEGLDLIVCAEAARLKFRTWDQYLRPALADRGGKAIFTSTPRGFNWFYEFYKRGLEDGQTNWRSWKIPSRMNPILPDSEIIEAKMNSTPESFKQEWEGEFIAYAGLVFPEFSTDEHVRALPYNPLLRTAIWVDPGTTAPYAALLVQITPDENVHVLDEIYHTGWVTEQVIREAKNKWGRMVLNDYDAPKEEVEVIVDAAAQEATATWRLNGWRAGGEKPKIRQGIEVHHKFLQGPGFRHPGTNGPDDPGSINPRVLFDPKCHNVINEHNLYHYPDDTRKRIETNKSELPVDVDNHAIDALRYGYYNTFRELFNIADDSETIVTATPEEMGLDLDRMKIESFDESRDFMIEDSYSDPYYRDTSLT